jgi:P-47 protein
MSNYPDTHGWDTVFAVSTDRVNVALANVAPSPSYSRTLPITGGSATVNWTFTNWQVTDTPGGDSLVVRMDFGAGSVMTSTGSGVSPSTPLDSPQWSCDVTIRAHFDQVDSVTHKLRAITSTGQAWAVVSIVPPNTNPPFADVATLQLLIDDWFNSEGDSVTLFEQEFATVNIGASVGTGSLAWLSPVTLGFAGAKMADGVTKAMGILAMTSADKSPEAASLELSPYAIKPNAVAGYVVSRELVMRHMFLPACCSAFSLDDTGTADSYRLSGDDSSVLTNTAALHYLQEVDGVQRTATLAPNTLRLALDGDSLALTMTPLNVETKYPGISLDVTITERLQMSLNDNPNHPGSRFFALTEVDGIPPKIQMVASAGVEIATAVIGGLITLVSLALSVKTFKGPLMRGLKLSESSAKVWARVIAVVVSIASTFVASRIAWLALAEKGEVSDIADFGPVLTSGLAGITWPGSGTTNFVAVEGEFADGMLITVDPQF